MTLRIRFPFDGRCGMHPRYNPEKDGRPQNRDCPGCDSLYVIHLYVRIARRKAEIGDGLLVNRAPQIEADSSIADEKAEEITLTGQEVQARDATPKADESGD